MRAAQQHSVARKCTHRWPWRTECIGVSPSLGRADVQGVPTGGGPVPVVVEPFCRERNQLSPGWYNRVGFIGRGRPPVLCLSGGTKGTAGRLLGGSACGAGTLDDGIMAQHEIQRTLTCTSGNSLSPYARCHWLAIYLLSAPRMCSARVPPGLAAAAPYLERALSVLRASTSCSWTPVRVPWSVRWLTVPWVAVVDYDRLRPDCVCDAPCVLCRALRERSRSALNTGSAPRNTARHENSRPRSSRRSRTPGGVQSLTLQQQQHVTCNDV